MTVKRVVPDHWSAGFIAGDLFDFSAFQGGGQSGQLGTDLAAIAPAPADAGGYDLPVNFTAFDFRVCPERSCGIA
jgi:hypothetical protein